MLMKLTLKVFTLMHKKKGIKGKYFSHLYQDHKNPDSLRENMKTAGLNQKRLKGSFYSLSLLSKDEFAS